jgi:hypothetical protein
MGRTGLRTMTGSSLIGLTAHAVTGAALAQSARLARDCTRWPLALRALAYALNLSPTGAGQPAAACPMPHRRINARATLPMQPDVLVNGQPEK